jgi:ubiquitin C-terminal hydrolase
MADKNDTPTQNLGRPVSTHEPITHTQPSLTPQTLPFYTGWRNYYQAFDPVGIFNPLNLCYRNVILQLLLHTPLLLNFVELNCVPGHTCVEPATLCTFCVLKAFIDAYWTESRNDEAFTRALDALWEKLLVSFWASAVEDLNEQQDAREFLERTLAQFHIESMYVDVSASFQIVTNKHFQCRTCNATRRADSLDQQYFLIADFPTDGRRCTIDDAILPGMHNALVHRCPRCNADTEHTMVDKIVQLPEVLLVQVNRFAMQQDDQTKVQKSLQIDEHLAVSDAIRDADAPDHDPAAYELYAVVFHRGVSIYKGHYTAAVKSPDGRWALLDDDSDVVYRDSLDDLKAYKRTFERQAYILAYRRLPLSAEPAPSHRPYATKSIANLPAPTDSDGDTTLIDEPSDDSRSSTSIDRDALPVAGGVHLLETIAFDGHDVDWIVSQQLLLPPEAGPLINLPPRAKVQRAKVRIVMTSRENGDVLEGEVTISLRPQRQDVPDASVVVTTERTPLIKRLRPRGKPQAKPAKTMNTKGKSKKTKAESPGAQAPAKPRGVAKSKAGAKAGAKASAKAKGRKEPTPTSSTPSQCSDPDGWVRRSKRWHKHHPTYAESTSS